MKRHNNNADFEEDEAGIESRERKCHHSYIIWLYKTIVSHYVIYYDHCIWGSEACVFINILTLLVETPGWHIFSYIPFQRLRILSMVPNNHWFCIWDCGCRLHYTIVSQSVSCGPKAVLRNILFSHWTLHEMYALYYNNLQSLSIFFFTFNTILLDLFTFPM